VTTTIMVAMHEIPQELGDFGVLLHANFSPSRALLLNFLTAWSAVVGAVLGFIFLKDSQFSTYLLPLAAGGFLYLSASDLLPEIRKENKIVLAFFLPLTFIAGLAFMWFLV